MTKRTKKQDAVNVGEVWSDYLHDEKRSFKVLKTTFMCSFVYVIETNTADRREADRWPIREFMLNFTKEK